MPIATTPDHVAVAVPSIDRAARRWHDQLGGGWSSPRFPTAGEPASFATRQLRYPGGATLELLEPLDDDGFAAGFLSRFGARVHHVTLTVDALLPAVDRLREEGLEARDVRAEGDVWHEAFLRPSQVGGLIVQLAWAGRSEEEWLQQTGTVAEPPRPDAARLLGPTLAHPDLDRAAWVWTTLGAEVEDGGPDALLATWPGAPLTVRVERGPRAEPVGLRFQGTAPLPADPALAGPAVLLS